MKTRAAKYISYLTLVVIGFHYTAIGMTRVENFTVEQYQRTKSAAIEVTAERLGLERKIQIDPLTAIEIAEREALRKDISPSIIRAIMHLESHEQKYAESPKGAIGLMQIMPANAKRVGLDHWSKLFDPETNIKAGVQIFSEELTTYKGDVFLALVAYNGGPQAVKGAYPDAVKYAQNVLNIAARDIR